MPLAASSPDYTRSMLLDRAFRLTFRNFSTLFLIVATIVVPLHLIFSFYFRDVVAVSELHSAIEDLPGYLQVKGVKAREIRVYRSAFLALSAAELALIPALAAATRRALETDARGLVPTATGAWKGLRELRLPRPGSWTTVAVATGCSLLLGALVEVAGSTLLQPVPETSLWIAQGLVQGLSRSLAAPFALTALVVGQEIKGKGVLASTM